MQLESKETTKDKLFNIVVKASNLQERIALYSNSSYRQAKVNFSGSKERWEKWTEVVAKGNKEKFHRRLKWAGLDREKLTSILADDFPLITELPTWAITLEKIIETAEKNYQWSQESDRQQYFITDEPIPFEDFYLPFIELAREKILASHPNEWQKLSSQAQIDLLRGLLARLSYIGAATLMQEFDRFRIANNSLKDLLSLQFSLNISRKKYDLWLNELLSTSLWELFSKYSVLGRLLATASDFWVKATADFLESLTTDWQVIEDNFSSHEPLQKVIACQCNLSDSHNSGHSVIIVTFNTALKVVYKPRDLGLETAFYQIIDWCNEQPELLSLPRLQILNYTTHGWSEYVAALPCENESAIKRFFQRSGMLICLVHILEGQDFHSENLIANGEYPVLVDLEALLHSQINSQQITQKDAFSIAKKEIKESVFQTYLLPQWGLNANDSLKLDISGLGNTEEDNSLKTFTLKHINTDSMQIDYKILKLENANSPVLNEVKISAANYVAEIVQGFEQMYDCLLKNQVELLSNSSLLKLMENQKVRFLFRNTKIYAEILQKSYHPDVLEYGIDRSIALDVLSRGFLLTEEKPTYWSILNAEIKSMEQLDIPLFLTNSSSTDFQLSEEEVIHQVLSGNSFNKLLNHIQQLSETDKQKQISFIKSAFIARFLQQPQLPDSIENHSIENYYVKKPEDTPDCNLLIEQAIGIAKAIENQAIRGENNSFAWLGLVYNPATPGFRFQPLEQLGLADGNLGIALFIAALAKITGDEKWRNLALQILKPIESALRGMNNEEKSRFIRITGIGGFNGLGASAYSLIQIAQLLSESSLIPIADDVLSMITIDKIVNSPQLNIISGCAGTLLSLLGCLSSKIDNYSEYLQKAIACGDYLLQHQAPPETEIDSRSLGFWSGIAGVAYALLRLYEVTQDERYLTTAKNAITLESKATNFHDSNLNQLKIEIAFGRLGGINLLDNYQIKTEINTAIEIIQQHKMWGVDNLFWGNYGRLELLLVASEKLEKPELKTLADNWAKKITAKTTSNKLKLFVDSPSEISHPGFLHGTAGIGYQLLRIAYPQLLPSILLFQ